MNHQTSFWRCQLKTWSVSWAHPSGNTTGVSWVSAGAIPQNKLFFLIWCQLALVSANSQIPLIQACANPSPLATDLQLDVEQEYQDLDEETISFKADLALIFLSFFALVSYIRRYFCHHSHVSAKINMWTVVQVRAIGGIALFPPFHPRHLP